MVIIACLTNAAKRSNLLISSMLKASADAWLLCFHFFFFSEIYRWVKIGLWIWFITTKLFGWIALPQCPWCSQESFTWHPATSYSLSPLRSLPPSVVLWFCGAELISVNFWKALCYTAKWVSKEVIREEVFWLMSCYFMSKHLRDLLWFYNMSTNKISH